MIVLLLASCAPGTNEFVDVASENGNLAGFWMGLWHGMISFFTFIGSLFSNEVNIYEVHNNGGWYNFGFLLGVGGSGGGASYSTSRRNSN